LVVPDGTDVRPTSDRVREALFNALFSLDDAVAGATVLDLFAGTGALGLEALSRGAARATFVETNRLAADALRTNIEALGFGATATIVRADARRWLAGAPRFDLAFLDPPYDFDGWDALLGSLRAGLVVTESNRPISAPEGWGLVRARRYGSTVVQILRPVAPLE
jgi:16S rRNA (guanine966-N2)-methyltransferase